MMPARLRLKRSVTGRGSSNKLATTSASNVSVITIPSNRKTPLHRRKSVGEQKVIDLDAPSGRYVCCNGLIMFVGIFMLLFSAEIRPPLSHPTVRVFTLPQNKIQRKGKEESSISSREVVL